MHLLDTYALHCGLKVDKPYIYTLYYPLGVDRYITFQPFSNFAEKQYDFWNEVIDYLSPILKDQGIRIAQIGAKDDTPMKECIWTQGTTKISQAAYLIKNGMLHLGVDSFGAHVASGFNKKIVALYSTNWANNCKPYWSDPKDVRLFEPDRSVSKPTFNHEEGPDKSINKIKPEDIANSVLDLLGSKAKVKKETVFFGDDYNKMKMNIVPSSASLALMEFGHLIVRMDLHFDEEVLEFLIQNYPSVSIITKKPIDTKLLKHYKNKIQDIVYWVNEDNDIEFVKGIHGLGINYILLTSLTGDKFSDLKFKYLDYNFIFQRIANKKKRKEILKLGRKNLQFRTRQKIVKDGKVYNGVAALKKGVEENGLVQESFVDLIDTEDFWVDLEDAYIVKKLD
tara:strand:+ start:129 stop:1313 length:1185 start_codon:yes stop_codon:yes gene_type:complete